MKRLLKLTSPGVLLILAVASACGIFLLDVFYLAPQMRTNEQEALRHRALAAETSVSQALSAERSALLDMAEGIGRSLDDGDLERLGSTALRPAGVDFAWVGEAGSPEAIWLSDPAARSHLRRLTEEAARVVRDPAAGQTGLVQMTGGVALFARGRTASGRELWLARTLQGSGMDRVAAAVQGRLAVLAGDDLPEGLVPDGKGRIEPWLVGDVLAAVWPITDATGRRLGYFHTQLNVAEIRRQASVARRSALIVSSLSVGLALLVILGTHMLITGPVVRLLHRIQLVQSGQSAAGELTRDMHGEPLVIARELESAFERMAHLSTTDQLTGLANRGHFQDVMHAFYEQARRYNRPLSVIMIDVDFFKAVNDTGGHQAGDRMLVFVARAIEGACRKADLPARLGGDEFAVILPETRAGDAGKVAERIADEVRSHPFRSKNIEMQVTLSVGVADLNAGEIASAEDMLALVDRALYAAKSNGRDQIVQAHDVDGESDEIRRDESGRVDELHSQLAGMNDQFKGMFVRAMEEILEILAQRDPNMARHACKVQDYAGLIAREMGLQDHLVKRIETAAILHDVGMLALPDNVLLCPGKLEDEQLDLMRRHPLLSVRVMEGMRFLEQEIPAVRHHHEHYDGSGYPEGLCGSAIPLSARILCVADAFEAITSPRTFRDAHSVDEAFRRLRDGAGSQFDPAVVEALEAVLRRMGDAVLDRATETTHAPAGA